MERREFVAALGFAAWSASAIAGEAAPKPAGLAVRPNPIQADLARASSLCVAAGQECLRRALTGLAAKDVSLIDCANSAADVVAACGALAALAATGAPFALGFARTVADVCRACKQDCDKLARIAECVALGAACATCAAECAKAAG